MPNPTPDLRSGAGRERWLAILTQARQRHFLGPGDVEVHLRHSLAFTALVPTPPGHAVDLGSGAGIPGLILAAVWPGSRWALVDANERRAEFLRESAAALGLDRLVEVLAQRAEVIGRDTGWRESADLVVARGFAPPAVTAECAAPLLAPGGLLVVADPPGGVPGRWPLEGLAMLGLEPAGSIIDPVALQRLRQVAPCPDRFPRRVGIPSKRPLW